MAIRFHRSIRIAKGIRLTFSKKGLGASIGPKGAKVSVGPSGVYSNIGIPGTGVYSRTKLSGPSNPSKASPGPSTQSVLTYFEVQVSIDEQTGIEEITMLDEGTVVTDPSLLRRMRADAGLKEHVQQVREKTYASIEEKSQVLVHIHKHSIPLPNWEEIRVQAETQTPEHYVKEEFTIKKPDAEELHQRLEDEASKEVKGFFGLKKKRKEYVDQRIDAFVAAEANAWQKAKDEFEKAEADKERSANSQFQREFASWKEVMEATFNPTVEYLEEKLDRQLSEIQLPVEFSLSFEVLDDGKAIHLDIELPKIEDYPQKKARILSTGKISVKDKAQKEKKAEYLRSISGMSIYFASMAFALSPAIEEVIISGYTQRVNKASGNVEDEYVYSVKYDVQRFSTLNSNHVEPELTIQSFEHRMEANAQYDLKTIIPFEA
ncbi:MAG: DUF4236 domain-containing protein [Sphaerochaeta sp.]|nr:DUF4236 domain-containing protein [Sphaerochaeta sp.]